MEYVYANNEGDVLHAPTRAVEMHLGDVFDADDPFVLARPDLFSKTPVVVRSTVGRPERREAIPLDIKRKARARG
jgi:hypothetical protein